MRKTTFLKSCLLLVAMLLGVNSAWADNYELYSGQLTEGDYIIYYDGKAMNTTVTSSRLQYAAVTPTDNVITTTEATIVWHIAPSGDYWTIYNAGEKKYAAGTGAKNKAQMLADGTDDQSLWTVTGEDTYEFVNKANAAAKVNANLRNNGTYGFACYASTTGGPLQLYKKVAAASTQVSKPVITGEASFLTSTTVTITCSTEGATILYSLDDGANWKTYTAPFTITDTKTVKAKATKNGMTESDVAEKTFTKAIPLTVEEARAAIDAGSGTSGVYAQGIVSEIVTEYNANFSNITFNISSDGKTTSDQLQAFRCIGEKANEIRVGDDVIIFGNLKKHSDTYEFDQACKLVSLQHSVLPYVSSIPLDGFTYVVGNGPSQSKSVHIQYENLFGGNRMYKLSIPESSNWEISVDENGQYGNEINISIVQDGSLTTITPFYVRLKAGLEVGDYSESFVFEFVSSETTSVFWVAEFSGSVTAGPNFKWNMATNSYASASENLVTWKSDYATMTIEKGTSNSNANNYLGGTNTQTRIYKNNILTFTPETGYEIEKVEITTVDDKAAGFTGNNWTNASTSTSGAIVTITPAEGKLAFSTVISEACRTTEIRVFYKETTSAVIAINEACTDGEKYYATFSASKAFIVPAGLTVSEIKVADGALSVSNYAEGAIVPANTGVMVSAAVAGNKTVELSEAAGTSVLGAENMLKASSTEMDATGAYKFYRLTMHNGTKIGFYWGAAEGAAFNIAANKAYLAVPVDAVGAAREFMWFGNSTTGVDNVRSKMSDVRGQVFDLQGRCVAQPQKGLYIMNGKKMVIK